MNNTTRLANCPHDGPPGERRRPADDWERDHCTTVTELYCRGCGATIAVTGEGPPV